MRTTASLLRLLLLLIISIILMEWVYETDKQWAMLSEPIYWAIIGTVLLFGMAFEICIEALRVILFKTLGSTSTL